MKDVKTIRAEKPAGVGAVGTLEEIVRRGAQRFLEGALNQEVDIFCQRHGPGWTNTGIGWLSGTGNKTGGSW